MSCADVVRIASPDPEIRAFPEGVIDPLLKTIAFYDQESLLGVLTYYATHPQSYYRTKTAHPDFPGMARENRQAELAGQLARRIQRWGLGGPVSVILDALEPFAFVGGQLLWILQPTLGLLVNRERIAEFALMLERPEALRLLRAQLKES